MEKSIRLTTEEVRAVLEGRKTQKRIVIKPQPVDTSWFRHIDPVNGAVLEWSASTAACVRKLPYQIDDILWVRETWTNGRVSVGEEPDGSDSEPFISQCINEDDIIYKEDAFRNGIDISETTWRPSIHMPRTAARLFLQVKNVRVERLQDITEEDARAEGIKKSIFPYQSSKPLFSKLWNSTIKKQDFDRYSWDANPWVWVIEFERVKGA